MPTMAFAMALVLLLMVVMQIHINWLINVCFFLAQLESGTLCGAILAMLLNIKNQWNLCLGEGDWILKKQKRMACTFMQTVSLPLKEYFMVSITLKQCYA